MSAYYEIITQVSYFILVKTELRSNNDGSYTILRRIRTVSSIFTKRKYEYFYCYHYVKIENNDDELSFVSRCFPA